ncbi:MAG: hypothetical protein E7Z72_03845 [Methanocorpusculum parvum]|nr:hypothetical protein [Methanocorpusculum parvum]
MTNTRRTYKTAKPKPRKTISITFRVTEEEQTIIRRNAQNTGCRTESEYLRLICLSKETDRITNEELKKIKTDITYCTEWIKEHKNTNEPKTSEIHIELNLFSKRNN